MNTFWVLAGVALIIGSICWGLAVLMNVVQNGTKPDKK